MEQLTQLLETLENELQAHLELGRAIEWYEQINKPRKH